MKIPLGDGLFALIDDDDAELAAAYKWRPWRSARNRRVYPVGKRFVDGQQEIVQMHRLILPSAPDVQVDHINGDGLDNRRSNLRRCTQSENLWNQPAKANSKTGLRGVYYRDDIGKYHGSVTVNRKRHWTGWYLTAREAAMARDRLAVQLHGEFAYLNFPEIAEIEATA